jgi:CBS domain-containing protein
MIFALELTHDLNLLPGLMVGCITAHASTVLMLRRSILTEKVARRGFHIAREYAVDPLSITRVGEVMDPNPPLILATMRLAELSDRIARQDPKLIRRHAHLLVDEGGQLLGIITRGDLLRAMEQKTDLEATVLDAGSRELIVAYPDEVLHDAVTKMVQNDLGRLPVVTREQPTRPIGYLGRSNVMKARVRWLNEEHVRERGIGTVRKLTP